MAVKKGKSVSFDAMVKFFMQTYNIPTKKDVDKLMAKLDRLEKLIKEVAAPKKRAVVARKTARSEAEIGRSPMTASDMVLQIVRDSKQGIGFPEIKAKTGFEEKKLRNIIFRMNKIGKIKRKERGIYMAA